MEIDWVCIHRNKIDESFQQFLDTQFTQIFLGALLCFVWLMLVTIRRPYEAYWDNVLSIVLSSQLVLIMLCGSSTRLTYV